MPEVMAAPLVEVSEHYCALAITYERKTGGTAEQYPRQAAWR